MEGSRRDLWLASESVQAALRDATATLQARMQDMAKRAAEETEEKWCRKLQRQVEAAESVIREVDERCRRETLAAHENLQMQQSHFENKLESLRLDSYQEAKRRAAEAVGELRSDIISGKTWNFDTVNSKIEACQVALGARLKEACAKLHEAMLEKSEETLARADERADVKVEQLGANIAEAVEATRNQIAALARSHNESVEHWRVQIRDTHMNAAAADALNRGIADELRGRLEGLGRGSFELKTDLASARQSANDAVAALRGELGEHVVRWRTFEDVGIPGLLSTIEQKASETESRSLRAALDYAERLRKLPPPASESTRMNTTGGSLQSMGDTQSGWRAASSDTGSPRAPCSPVRSASAIDAPLLMQAPLPPLTPSSARKPKTR